MAFQAVPETAEIVIRYVQNNQNLVTVLHADKAGGYDLADLTLLAVAVDIDVAAFWLPQQTDNCTYLDTTVRGLALENDQEVVVNTNTGPGARLSLGNPNSVTISIKKLSGLTGRSARGRVFWIGLPQDQLSGNENVVIAVNVTAIVAAIEAVRSNISATVWNAVIVSRFTGGVKRPFGVRFPWVDTVAVNADVDSQRRRLGA